MCLLMSYITCISMLWPTIPAHFLLGRRWYGLTVQPPGMIKREIRRLISTHSYGGSYIRLEADFTAPLTRNTNAMVGDSDNLPQQSRDRSFELMYDQGPVFRVSPNELSFASADSWKAIYGHQPAGKPTAVKSKFYDMYGSGYNSLCIGSERDPKRHSAMKRNLTAAFSTRALLEQESIIGNCIDDFVTKVGEANSKLPQGLNMTKWYEMLSFDILGEMAFGESFHAVESGTLDSAPAFTLLQSLKLPQENLIFGPSLSSLICSSSLSWTT